MKSRVYNFSAGPAVLPEEVLKKAQQDLWDLSETGIGVLEHSHRGKAFTKVLEDAEKNIREVADISDDYAVLFLQGGASTQFFMAPMNWLGGGSADYVDTGAWSKKAIAEGKRFGSVHVAGSSADENYSYIPAAARLSWSEAPAYAHITSNNTIFGTQWAGPPEVGAVPLISDASSDIFCRPLDISKYAMVYAGAQKNLGPSGVTLVVVRRDWAEKGASDLPTMLQYRTHIANDSCYNTPPTFGIYIIGEVLKWIRERGGLEAMHEKNRAKAALIYNFLDASEMFRGTARGDSRSLMNVTFRGKSEESEAQFIAEATAEGLVGLKGHRSVGGMRASIYNAMPSAGCEALVDFMKRFEQKNR